MPDATAANFRPRDRVALTVKGGGLPPASLLESFPRRDIPNLGVATPPMQHTSFRSRNNVIV
jgi:hypothetical protein